MVENAVNSKNDLAMVVREPQMISPNNTEMIAYTGDRKAPVQIRKRKVDMAVSRPLILRKRMNVEGDVRPGVEGQQLLEDL